MDKQIVFNTVVNHLRTQGKRASGSTCGGCFYRIVQDGKTLKCAVGCLIPDHLYLPVMENATVWATPGMYTDDDETGKRGNLLRAVLALSIPDFNPDPKSEDVQFLARLQQIHDGSSNAAGWESCFVQLAKEYDLTVPPKELPFSVSAEER